MGRPRQPLAPGRRVTVRRADRSLVSGVVVEGPLEHLRPIGEFYLIGERLPSLDKPKPARRSGRKSKRALQYETETGRIGMYERSKLIMG